MYASYAYIVIFIWENSNEIGLTRRDHLPRLSDKDGSGMQWIY
jgi:hypothetical protein